MSAPYSQDLRLRVIAAVEEEGMSRSAAARRFGIGRKTAIRWVKVYRDEGRDHALPLGQGRVAGIADHRDMVLALVKSKLDWTLRRYCEALAAKGIKTSEAALFRFLRDCGITRKKRR